MAKQTNDVILNSLLFSHQDNLKDSFWKAEVDENGNSMPITITYTFLPNGGLPAYYSDKKEEAYIKKNFPDATIPTDCTEFTQAQKVATKLILDAISKIIGVNFVEKAYEKGNEGQITFGNSESIIPKIGYGQGFAPGYDENGKELRHGGDVWISLKALPIDNSVAELITWAENGIGYITLIHEICHALGMKHPHDGPKKLTENDDENHTVMTYKNDASGVHASTLMPYDILSLQSIYGEQTDAKVDDSVKDNTSHEFLEDIVRKTLWDQGGTGDTVDLGNKSFSCTIDLDTEEGRIYKTASGPGPKNDFYIAIAKGVQIENATGGSNNDNIIGNDADNVLAGGIGGGDGNDTLEGGAGNDTYVFVNGFGQDTITNSDKSDRILLTTAGRTLEEWKKNGEYIDAKEITAAGKGVGIWETTINGREVLLEWSGSGDLVIHYKGDTENSITVENFRNGDLGIDLPIEVALLEGWHGDFWAGEGADLASLAGLTSVVGEGCARLYTVCLNTAARAGDELRVDLSGAGGGFLLLDGQGEAAPGNAFLLEEGQTFVTFLLEQTGAGWKGIGTAA